MSSSLSPRPGAATPKISSRPRSIMAPKASALPFPTPSSSQHHARSPPAAPLTTSLNSNLDPSSALSPSIHQTLLSPPSTFPSQLGTPGSGSVKIKVKSMTTPEARSRVLLKPKSARALHRAMTPSDSEGSLDAWIGAPAGGEVPETPAGVRVGLGISSGLEPPVEIGSERQLIASEAVLVTVRIRPPNEVELRTDSASTWVTPRYDQHLIKLAKRPDGAREDKEWIFDRILPPDTDNALTYGTSAQAHVRSAMEGFNAVIFAYGQTASGKTFTLTGSPSNPGIIPLAITDLFAQIQTTPDREFLLRASYLELYNETILDLLSPEHRELSLSEGKKKGEVVINGLTECAVRTEEEVKRLLKMGEERRSVGGTDWNQRSSRSHCVFRITIESRSRTVTDGSRTPGRGDKTTRISTLSIIDLAGSERHTSSKERNAEGKHINQSLLTLKLVISKLADLASKRNITHIPYRDSKLTRLLQPSLSGDALISVICTVSPSAINLAESISTLSFAQGLKRVVLSARKKEVVDPEALIQQYQVEIAELRALLREKEDTTGGFIGVTKGDSVSQRVKSQEMESRLNELKSLILTSGTVAAPTAPTPQTRPLSPAKLKYPKLELDKSSSQLREDLHAAEMKMAEQSAEIERLQLELGARPLDPDARCQELQDECAQLRMIAADYERHLREPSRKVREDVEKEWAGKMAKVESQLESKTIWANRLDENVRALAMEKRALEMRCEEAEAKVQAIFEWVNTALTDSIVEEYEDDLDNVDSALPTLVVTPNPDPSELDFAQSDSLDALTEFSRRTSMDDFGPPLPSQATGTLGSLSAHGHLPRGTLKLTASKMTRSQLSAMDLTAFTARFGTLGKSKMIREESSFALAAMDDDESEFGEGF